MRMVLEVLEVLEALEALEVLAPKSNGNLNQYQNLRKHR